MCPWYFTPHAGGAKIPPAEYSSIISQANAYAATRPWNSTYKLQLRFKSQFCYVDSIEKDGTICALGRLRHMKSGRWSMAFFTYSNDRYTPCCLSNGEDCGSFEEALAVCEAYLD